MKKCFRELSELTSLLMDAYKAHQDNKWQWFEDILTYDNAILPLAVISFSRNNW